MSVRGMFFFAGALDRPVRRQYAESGMETRVNWGLAVSSQAVKKRLKILAQMRPTYHWCLSTRKESKRPDKRRQIWQFYPDIPILGGDQNNQYDEQIIALLW